MVGASGDIGMRVEADKSLGDWPWGPRTEKEDQGGDRAVGLSVCFEGKTRFPFIFNVGVREVKDEYKVWGQGADEMGVALPEMWKKVRTRQGGELVCTPKAVSIASSS